MNLRAAAYENETGKTASGRMLREIEESCLYLIDLANLHGLDLGKILNHTAKNGDTLFRRASFFSEIITRRLLGENVRVNSITDFFSTPVFKVKLKFVNFEFFSMNLRI